MYPRSDAEAERENQSELTSDSNTDYSSSSSSSTLGAQSKQQSRPPRRSSPNSGRMPLSNPVTSTPSTAIPVASVTTSAVVARVLPSARDKSAPLIFTGRSSEVEDFLSDFEDVCVKYRITSDKAKVKGVLKYCAQAVKRYIQVQEEYIKHDWEGLKKVFLHMYDADGYQSQFTIGDVHSFAIESSTNRMITKLEDWHRYLRKFEAMAGQLRLKGKISEEQFNMYLWMEIENTLRESEVEPEIRRANPKHDGTITIIVRILVEDVRVSREERHTRRIRNTESFIRKMCPKTQRRVSKP